MLPKDVLEIVFDRRLAFCSRLSLVEKASDRWKPFIDMSPLNTYLHAFSKYKMETVNSLLAFIRKGDIMFSIDLKDAYFQIPVHPELMPYLQFALNRTVFQFKAQCFGLLIAFQVFTRVFRLALTWVYQQGIYLL